MMNEQQVKKELEINLPTNPDIIEEYLYLLNIIDKETQRASKEEWIKHGINQGLFASGVPVGEQETNILRKWNQEGIIKLKNSNLDGKEYWTYLKPTERFQEYKKRLEEQSKKVKAKDEEIRTQDKLVKQRNNKARIKETEKQFGGEIEIIKGDKVNQQIIGRDKIEQSGNKNITKTKNITNSYPTKKWFSMDNPIIYIIVSIILSLTLYFLYRNI